MRELYYAIYRNSDYETVVMTSLAEAVVARRGCFGKDRFLFKNRTGLSRYEKQILSKIVLSGTCHFHLSDYQKWEAEVVKECLEMKYLKRAVLAGVRPTKLLRKEIGKSMARLDTNIIAYIDSKDIGHLVKIDKSLRDVNLPRFQRPTVQPDRWAEMASEVIANGYFLEADED